MSVARGFGRTEKVVRHVTGASIRWAVLIR